MKKIFFNLRPEDDPRVILPPEPGSQFVPKWYRDGEKYIHKETGLKNPDNPEDRQGGMKSCMPFLDALISGYIQPLSVAIRITKNNGTDAVEWEYVEKMENGEYVRINLDFNIVNERFGDLGETIPRPAGHSHNHLAWSGKWGWGLPKGWSALVCHPLNRYDLPFTVMNGIMESDRFQGAGNVPFFIRKDFVGVIEKGTPMFQVIPIKRAKWLGYVQRKIINPKSLFMSTQARNVNYGFYRDKMWEKKHYDMEK